MVGEVTQRVGQARSDRQGQRRAGVEAEQMLVAAEMILALVWCCRLGSAGLDDGAPRGAVAFLYSAVTSTCTSLMRRVVCDCGFKVTVPPSPSLGPPVTDQVTSQVVMPVIS